MTTFFYDKVFDVLRVNYLDAAQYELPWDVKTKVVDWLREADEKYHEFGRAYNVEPSIVREPSGITARSELMPTEFSTFVVVQTGEKVCAGYYLAQKISGQKNIDTFHWKGILINFGIPAGLVETIVYYNDTHKLTFAQIAKLIDDKVKIEEEPNPSRFKLTDLYVV